MRYARACLVASLVLASAPVSSTAARAESSEGIAHPLPAGIVFPGFNSAASINPAGLAGPGQPSRVVALQAFDAPPIWGSSAHRYGADAAASFGSFGVGGGISRGTFNGLSNGGQWNAAAAGGAGPISVGATVGSHFGSTLASVASVSNSIDFALGMLYSSGAGVAFAADLLNLSGATQLALGVGYFEKKKYNLEANLMLPPFSTITSNYSYDLSVAAAVYAGIFGVSYNATASFSFGGAGATSSSFILSQSVAAMLRPFEKSYFSLTFWNVPIGASAVVYPSSNATFAFTLVL